MLRYLLAFVLVMVGFTLPFDYLSISLIPGQSITPTKTVNAMLLGLVALQWATGGGSRSSDSKLPWLVAFGVVLCLSGFQSLLVGVPFLAVFTIWFSFVMLLLFYIMLTFVLTDRKRLDLLLGALAVGCGAVVVTGALGFGEVSESVKGDRVGGLGGNANFLAMNLILGIPVAYTLFTTSRSKLWRLVLAAAIALSVVGLLNTLSRAAFVAVPFMLLLWMVRFRRLDLLRYAIPVLALAALGLFYLPETVQDRIATLSPDRFEEDSSAVSRVLQLEYAMRAFFSNPLLGVGLNGFIPWAIRVGIGKTWVVHSSYLQTLAETGLLGFIPITVVTVFAWRELSRSWQLCRRMRRYRDRELRILELRGILLQIGFLGCLVTAQFHPMMRHKTLWLLFALSTVVWRLVRVRAQELAESPQTSRAEEPEELAFHPGWEPAGAARSASR